MPRVTTVTSAPKWWRLLVKIENAREAALVAEIERLRKLLEENGINSDPTNGGV